MPALSASPITLSDDDEHLANFFTLSLDLLCIAGTDGYFKRLNPAFEDTLGYTTEELLEQPFLCFVHPDDRERSLEELEYLAAGAPTIDFVNRFRCKDGSYRWLSWNARPTQNGIVYATARDVTELRTTEGALRLHEERLRLLHRATASAGGFEAQMTHVLRLTADLLGLDVGLLSHIDGDCYTVVASSSEAIAPGATFELATTYCSITYAADDVVAIDRMAGSQHERHPCYAALGLEAYIGIPIRLGGARYGTLNFTSPTPRPTPFTDADASFLRLLAEWVASMLARHEAEEAARRREDEQGRLLEALRESEERYRMLFDTAPEAIAIQDQNQVLDANEALVSLLGAPSREAVLGMDVWSVILPEYHPTVIEAGSRMLKTWTPSPRVALQYRRFDGQVIDVEVIATPIRWKGQVAMQIAIADVSARKRAEAERERLLEELESANQELKDFAYVVSHDLKAPLRAIGSLASWLSADYADVLDADGQEQLGLLTGRVQRMHNLIEGILQYSRAGRLNEDKLDVDLSALVHQTTELFDVPPGMKITVETLLPTVRCEPTRMGQVFQNLIGNALKYLGKPEGTIRIGCEEDDLAWRFYVADDGPGIEARHTEKIFQLFQTLDARDDVESTGVGLALVKRIVELHGGRVWVESEPGAGATFYFTLPREAGTLNPTA